MNNAKEPRRLTELRNEERQQAFNSKVRPGPNGCLEWHGATHRKERYGCVKIAQKFFLTHRVAWSWANNQEIPAGMCIMHSCDNPRCVNPKHLSLGTHRQNTEDKMLKGRHMMGRRSKLNPEEVAQIKWHLQQGSGFADIADMFKVSASNIANIMAGKTWKRIQPAKKDKYHG